MKFNRYRMIKWVISGTLVVYIVMLYLHHNAIIASNKLEIYPFAGWRLFSYTPENFGIENAVVVDYINGQQADTGYLIPNNSVTSIDDQSVAKRTANACAVSANCSEAENLLFPVVERLVAEEHYETTENIEFSLVRVRIDYRDVLEHIRELADGTIVKSDFYKPIETIGRWSTRDGRIMDVSLLQESGSQYQDGNSDQGNSYSPLFPDTGLVKRSYFDIYTDDNSLIYARPSCTQTDIDTRFLLHIIPYYLNDLSEERKPFGFDNFDFSFQYDYSYQNNEYSCITVQELPEYQISGIRTGQFIDGTGVVWETQFTVPRQD